MNKKVTRTAARRYWKIVLSTLLGRRVRGPKYANYDICLTQSLKDKLETLSLERLKRIYDDNGRTASTVVTKEGAGFKIEWRSTLGHLSVVFKCNEAGWYIQKYRAPVLVQRLLEHRYDNLNELLEDLIFDSETTLERIVEDNAFVGLFYGVWLTGLVAIITTCLFQMQT